MTTPIRPWYNAARVTVPTGAIVPDLSVKGSIVLTRWAAQQQAQRAERSQRGRLQQQARSYEAASNDRFSAGWNAQATSADSELMTSLRPMRNRSRQLVRDNPYAKHAVRLLVNNIVGTGIGMQGHVSTSGGKLLAAVNDDIEAAWAKWADGRTCHTGGLLAWSDIERLLMARIVIDGEVLVRLVRQPFGGGKTPVAVEVIEADRLMDQYQTARAPNGNAIRMGVEVDQWGRPVAYWLTPNHPGDYSFASFEPSRFMRVPAEDIIHLYIIDRWPQTRGEPWFHASMASLHQQHGYEDAEVIKARASANVVGFIRSSEPVAPDEVDDQGRGILNTEPGTWQRLLPGEDVAGFSPSVPNPGLEPFLRYMVRKMAVGVGLSYESLSRDYNGATYSSARMGMLDDRDLYRVLQGWLIRNLRNRVHREWLDASVLVGAVQRVGSDYYSNPDKYLDVRFRPRGWTWIDPTKEVNAYKEACKAGFLSPSDVIAQTAGGADVEDVYKRIAADRDLADELDLVFDIAPVAPQQPQFVQPAAAPAEAPDGAAADGDQAERPQDDK